MLACRDYEVHSFSVPAKDGIQLVGDIAGESNGPRVVLLHGGGQTRHSWQGTFASLAADGFRVCAYDARGHGDSEWAHDGKYPFSQRAHDLISIVERIGDPVVLVGASMGGITSMQAFALGLRPRAMVLVDIVLNPERAGVQRVRDFMAGHPDGFATLDEAADAVAAYNPNRPRPKNSEGLLRNLRAGTDGRLRWHWDPRMVPDDLDDDMAQLHAIAGAFHPPADLPILLVHGGQSDVVRSTTASDFRRQVPHVEISEVPSAGHMVAGDSNSEFSRVILNFLGRQPLRPVQ